MNWNNYVKLVLVSSLSFSSLQGMSTSVRANEWTKEQTMVEESTFDGEVTFNSADFTISEDGILTAYHGVGGDVVIPEGVTVIGENAFLKKGVTSITLPSTLTTIQDYAFRENLLTYVSIPNRVNTIGYGAFWENNITSVTMREGLEVIGGYAFFNNKLNTLELPNTVTTIGYGAFLYNELESVYIPEGVVTIEEAAFRVNRLTTVELPDSVTFLGNYSFANNDLQSVRIPNGLTTIRYGTFGFNRLTSLVIPNSVTTIEGDAFSGNNLEYVEIPNSVTTIGWHAFFLNQLKAVKLPESVQSIGDRAFAQNRLTSVIIPSQVSEIGLLAFANNNIQEMGFLGDRPTVGGQWLSNQGTNTTISYVGNREGWDVPVTTVINESIGNFTLHKDQAPVIQSTDLILPLHKRNEQALIKHVSAYDEEDGVIVVRIKEHNVNFDQEGEYRVTYQASDHMGQVHEVNNRVTVVYSNEQPRITSKDLRFKARRASLVDLLQDVSATDYEDEGATVVIKEHNVDFMQRGTYFVTYSVTDSDHNTVEVTNEVIVESNEVPVINSKDLRFKVRKGNEEDLRQDVFGEDEEDGRIPVTIKEHTINFAQVGTYTITYRATDSDDNMVEVTNEVIIESDEVPVIVSKDLIFKARRGSVEDLLRDVYATDLEDGTIDVQIKTHTVNFNVVGVYDVIYTVIDRDGNQIEVLNHVFIESNEVPMIVSKDLTFKARRASLEDVVKDVFGEDEEDGRLDVQIKAHDINFTIAGTYHITYRVTDSDGNTVEKTNTVIIESNEVPVIVSKDLTFKTGQGSVAALLEGVSAFDAEDGALAVRIVPRYLDFNHIGRFTITYEAIDSDGNRVTSTINVEIEGYSDGWHKIDGNYYYYQDHQRVTGWFREQEAKYYLDPISGAMATGWMVIDGRFYHFYANGKMGTRWVHDGLDYYFVDEQEELRTGWLMDGYRTFYLDEQGRMQTGWQELDGKRYYFLESGDLAINTEVDGFVMDSAGIARRTDGWHLLHEQYFYYQAGQLRTGWLNENTTTYYLHPTTGVMATGWQLIEGCWYYFYANGKMGTGWVYDGEDYYYLYATGNMKLGWYLEGTTWYYLEKSGRMQSGWRYIDNTWYYFYSSGAMAKSTEIDGWIISGSGVARPK